MTRRKKRARRRELPAEVVQVLRDPSVYLDGEMSAVRKAINWTVEASLPMDQYTWTEAASSTTTPSGPTLPSPGGQEE